jgi:hypothetical protein
MNDAKVVITVTNLLLAAILVVLICIWQNWFV